MADKWTMPEAGQVPAILQALPGAPRIMNDGPPEIPAPKPRRTRSIAKAADRKSGRADGRTKATLLLPDAVDFRLTTIAASLKSDRSTLAAQLIDAGLRRYALDTALRQHTGGEGSPEPDRAGEG